MNARWSLLPVCIATLSACAQVPALLSQFALMDQEDAVRLSWTMVAGSTCQGTDVLRGRDSLQLSVVGGLAGLCGSLDTPASYDFTDTTVPGFGPWYYQLRLGLNGFSPVLRIEHLRSSSAELRVQADPATGHITIVLRADEQADVSLRIITSDGRPVLERPSITGNVHRLPVQNLPAGMYIVIAQWDGRTATGRFQAL